MYKPPEPFGEEMLFLLTRVMIPYSISDEELTAVKNQILLKSRILQRVLEATDKAGELGKLCAQLPTVHEQPDSL